MKQHPQSHVEEITKNNCQAKNFFETFYLFFCSLTAVLGMHSRFSISQLPNMKIMSHKQHNYILVQLHVLRMVSYKNFPLSLFNNYCVCDNTEWLRRAKILLVYYNTSSQKNEIWIFGFSQKKVDMCVTATEGEPNEPGCHLNLASIKTVFFIKTSRQSAPPGSTLLAFSETELIERKCFVS